MIHWRRRFANIPFSSFLIWRHFLLLWFRYSELSSLVISYILYSETHFSHSDLAFCPGSSGSFRGEDIRCTWNLIDSTQLHGWNIVLVVLVFNVPVYRRSGATLLPPTFTARPPFKLLLILTLIIDINEIALTNGITKILNYETKSLPSQYRIYYTNHWKINLSNSMNKFDLFQVKRLLICFLTN